MVAAVFSSTERSGVFTPPLQFKNVAPPCFRLCVSPVLHSTSTLSGSSGCSKRPAHELLRLFCRSFQLATPLRLFIPSGAVWHAVAWRVLLVSSVRVAGPVREHNDRKHGSGPATPLEAVGRR